LSHVAVNTLYRKLIDTKLLIIDEISMVGCKLFAALNFRL